MPYACYSQGCAGPPVIVITPLNGSDTMAVCGTCLPVTLAGMLASQAGIDPGKLWDAVLRLRKAAGKKGEQGSAVRDQPGEPAFADNDDSRGNGSQLHVPGAGRDTGAMAPAADTGTDTAGVSQAGPG